MGQIFTKLAAIARETGYPVIEVPGWRTHHHGAFADYVGCTVCHHTAGADPHESRSNYPSLNAVRNGVPGLDGPLSNFGLGFDGTIYVISSGTCWHAGRGGWAGMQYNSQAIGIEAEDAGDGDWTRAQLDCYDRLCAVICRFLGTDAGTVCGHKEWCYPPGRKIDPAGIHMPTFRGQVQWYLNNPNQIRSGNAPGGSEDDDMRDDERKMLEETHKWMKGFMVESVKNPYFGETDTDNETIYASTALDWITQWLYDYHRESIPNPYDDPENPKIWARTALDWTTHWVYEMRAKQGAMADSIAKLSNNDEVTAEFVEQVLRDAVAENMPQSIDVSGELGWSESNAEQENQG